MSAYVSNSVILGYGSSPTYLTLDALFADDESFEIVSLPKKRLDWTLLENIIGYRRIYTIRVQQITASNRNYLYYFIQSETQTVTINGSSHNVKLRDSELMLDLLDGYIGNVGLTMEFEDETITVPTQTFTAGITTSSAGYSSTASGSGTIVTLVMNYGSGDTKRIFRVNTVTALKADILDRRWEYIDKNRGVKKLGYRLNFFIDFGGFGLGQTQAQLQDDRDWIKEFVLAPSKRIEVFDQYLGDVVNDFDEVRYGYIGGSIYHKTVQLNFKQQGLQTNLPVNPSGAFILDSSTLGTLDNNILG